MSIKDNFFYSQNPKVVIEHSETILRLDERIEYLNKILNKYLSQNPNLYPSDKKWSDFGVPIFKEILYIEKTLKEAAKGERFIGDVYFSDVIELLSNSESNLKKRLAFLLSVKEDLKSLINNHAESKRAKLKLNKTILDVEKLITEAEKDIDRREKLMAQSNEKKSETKSEKNQRSYASGSRPGRPKKYIYIEVMYKFIEIRKSFEEEKRDLILTNMHDEIIPQINYNPESFQRFISRKKHLFPQIFHTKSPREILLKMNNDDLAIFDKNYKKS
jgi:hypothetical protein